MRAVAVLGAYWAEGLYRLQFLRSVAGRCGRGIGRDDFAASWIAKTDGALRGGFFRVWSLILAVYAFYIGPYVAGHFG